MSKLARILDPRGRTDRKGLLLIALIMLGVEGALFGAGRLFSVDFDSTFVLPIKAVLLWIGLAVTAKRLHDLGLSGFWIIGAVAAILVWAMAISLAIFFIAGPASLEPGALGFLIAYVATFLPVVAAALWLHLAPGQAGANRFGPAPGTGESGPIPAGKAVPAPAA